MADKIIHYGIICRSGWGRIVANKLIKDNGARSFCCDVKIKYVAKEE